MLDTIIEILNQAKDELFYNEDSWGTLPESQVDKIIHARCKVLYAICMLEGVKKYIDSFNNLIRFMR